MLRIESYGCKLSLKREGQRKDTTTQREERIGKREGQSKQIRGGRLIESLNEGRLPK